MEFKAAHRRRRPPESFYVFSIDARDLRRLAGIQRRSTDVIEPRSADTGIQRAHDPGRSSEINRFVSNGYPWSKLRDVDRRSGAYDDLRKPGWLPTAIVVNILTVNDRRPNGAKVASHDRLHVEPADGTWSITLPLGFGKGWKPKALHPIEVIDGQHRLWAFDESSATSYELPVVAFVGLDISWQAYLFWTINIMPTKLNPSLAFDLYPLLRSEDWLERVEGPRVYREARAQELTEVMWSHPESLWQRRINMLGQTRGLGATQAGWIRGLMGTFFRRSATRTAPGGLFAAPLPTLRAPLPWNRTQQAALLLFLWRAMGESVAASRDDWALFLREERPTSPIDDPAFVGRSTYLNTEQGVRALLAVANDFCFVSADRLELAQWEARTTDGSTDSSPVSKELAALDQQAVAPFLRDLTHALSSFDWRGADAPGLTDAERALKRAYRGSGGYVEFRRQLLRHLGRHAKDDQRIAANELLRKVKPPK